MTQALSRLSLEQLRHIFVLSAKADRQSKGQQSGDCWETLLLVCMAVCASPDPSKILTRRNILRLYVNQTVIKIEC